MEARKFAEKNKKVYEMGLKTSIVYGFFTFFTQWAMYACMSVIAFYGNHLYSQGKISIGNISSFLLYMI